MSEMFEEDYAISYVFRDTPKLSQKPATGAGHRIVITRMTEDRPLARFWSSETSRIRAFCPLQGLSGQLPEVPNHSSGLAAYDGWANGLEIDADYPAGDPNVMLTRLMVHGDQCVMLMDRRSAAKYLRDMMKLAPEAADELRAAADLYDAAAAEGDRLWPWKSCDYNDPELHKAMAQPELRKEMARHVRTAREKEMEAVGHLEKALAVLKAPKSANSGAAGP